jgi:hypothetical protein
MCHQAGQMFPRADGHKCHRETGLTVALEQCVRPCSLAFAQGLCSCISLGHLPPFTPTYNRLRQGEVLCSVLSWPSQNNPECNTVELHRAKCTSFWPVIIVTPILSLPSLGKPISWLKFSVNTPSCINPLFLLFQIHQECLCQLKWQEHGLDLSSLSLPNVFRVAYCVLHLDLK